MRLILPASLLAATLSGCVTPSVYKGWTEGVGGAAAPTGLRIDEAASTFDLGFQTMIDEKETRHEVLRTLRDALGERPDGPPATVNVTMRGVGSFSVDVTVELAVTSQGRSWRGSGVGSAAATDAFLYADKAGLAAARGLKIAVERAFAGGAATAASTGPSAVAGVRGLVAVLPIDVRQASVDDPTRLALDESVRSIAGDALTPLGYTVLTGDNTLKVLADNGIDPEKACEASCALAAAQELKASLFVSGTIARTEGDLVAFIRLYDARTGTQLASLSVEGHTAKELRQAFGARAEAFFQRGIAAAK